MRLPVLSCWFHSMRERVFANFSRKPQENCFQMGGGLTRDLLAMPV